MHPLSVAFAVHAASQAGRSVGTRRYASTARAAAVLSLKLAYDGTDFRGWACTAPRHSADAAAVRTVQGTLLTVLRQLSGGPAAAEAARLRVSGSSRTDAGVHASGQVACVHSDRPVAALACGTPADAVRTARRLNSMLPDDVRVLAAAAPPGPDFEARDSTLKRYAYRIDTSAVQSPAARHYAWHLPRGLPALDEMQAAAALLSSDAPRDFSAFAGTLRGSEGSRRRTKARSPECALRSVAVRADGDDGVVVTLVGDRFLYRMCRHVVGALSVVGRGDAPASDVAAALDGGAPAGDGALRLCAPAHGLTLLEVAYEAPLFGEGA